MTHFLTRIDINPRRRGTARLLASPHRVHGAVGTCFPTSRRPERVLWRVDRTAAGTVLYLVSDVLPDPTGFVEEYGWPAAGGWVTRDYGVLLDALDVGAEFAFRLTANPVRSGRAPGKERVEGARTQRFAHVTALQQLEWFLTRCEGWGFSVAPPVGLEADATVRVVERRMLKFPRQGRDVTIGLAAYEGVLTVTDVAELRRRLVEGIGHAKAYGCGLLTLAPSPR